MSSRDDTAGSGRRGALVRLVVWSFHSFVFASVPNVVFLVANMRQLPVGLSDAVRSALSLAAGNLALLVFLALARGTRSAAVTLSCFYIALSFFAAVTSIRMEVVPTLSPLAWSAAYLAFCLGVAFWLGRPPREDDRRYRPLNVAAIAILVSCAAIALYEGSLPAQARWKGTVAALARSAPVPPSNPLRRPDVYYIILDGMGRPDVVEREYGADAGTELKELERLGWKIPKRSRANYAQTYPSLASGFNGTYLGTLAEVMLDGSDRRPMFELLQRSGTLQGLKRIGYHFTLIGSNTSVTRSHRLADECVCDWPGLSEFENGLLFTTPFGSLPLFQSTYLAHYHTVTGAFTALREVSPLDRPQIVMAHVMLPHPPFVLDREGRLIPRTGPVLLRDGDHFAGTLSEYRHGYREQFLFALRQIVELARWVDDQRRDAIVVVHGDHGPGASYSHYHPTPAGLQERFPVLLALRLPHSTEPPPDDLSPVNVFRFIFNQEFGSNFVLLPNRSYYSPWEAPYSFSEVFPSNERAD